jgi:hypothetical protein
MSDLGHPLRDGLPVQAPSPSGLGHSAGIPDALLEAIALEFDPCIAKLIDRPFTAHHIGQALEWDSDLRAAAVCAVDSYHGFTCEFSPWERQHVSEYDQLEALLAKAMETGTAKTEGLGAEHDSAVASAICPEPVIIERDSNAK